MKLRVQYTAQLRAAVGHAEESVDLPEGSNLEGLLVQLAARWDRAKQHLLTDFGQPRPSLLVVLNGIAVPAREASGSVLHAGDVVVLMPPIAGG